ncbi:MAG: DUF1848 domain-containing protein [Thermoguttaceae bacterium]|jgi:hypothetical protein
MIISASRRTDIPAFYAAWMVRRLREGYCTVANPYNRDQVTWVSLKPEDVDAIVFWTRNPRPLMPYLDELDSRGYRYYFQFTILGYPREIDAKSPAAATAVEAFRDLTDRLGPKRVTWRYDPIVFTGLTPPAFHQENFQRLAESLRGHTHRVVVSIVDMYRKIEKRLKKLEGTPAAVRTCDAEEFGPLMRRLAGLAGENAMEIVSCSEEVDLRPFGILPGKCVDNRVIAEAFGIEVPGTKDPSQRKACGCVASRDIGMYESCLFGCQYCYATKSFEQARLNFESHDPESPSMLGWHEAAG